MKGIKGTRLWENPDLWPDYIRGALICSWHGHRFTVFKMYDVLCSRCRVCIPRSQLRAQQTGRKQRDVL